MTQQIYSNSEGKNFQVEKVIYDNQNIFVLKKRDNFIPFEKQFIDQIQSKNHRLLNIYDYFYSEGNVCIVQEYYHKGNLDKYLKQKGLLEIKEAYKILLQISKQLRIIHSMGFIYQDLKPENIVIKEINNKLKFSLCDFSSVIKMNHNIEDRQQTQSHLGTPNYKAPESFDLSYELDQTIDIQALGVLYYELVSGNKLFDGDNKQQIFKQRNEQSIQNQNEFYQELIIALKAVQWKDEILLSMFNPNPKNRPNIEQKKMLKSEIKAIQNELSEKNELNNKLIQENEQLNNKIQLLKTNSEQQQKESQDKYDKMEQQLEQKLSEITKLYDELQNLNIQEQIKFLKLKEELYQKMSLLEHKQKILNCFKKRDQQHKEQIQTLISQQEQIAKQPQFTELQYQESIKLLELKLQESQTALHKSEENIKNFMIEIQQNCDIIEKQKLELNQFKIKEVNQSLKVYSLQDCQQISNLGENEAKEMINQQIHQVFDDQNYKIRQQRIDLAKNIKETLQVKYRKVQEIQNKLNKINNQLEQKNQKIEELNQQIIVKDKVIENKVNQISQFKNNQIRENSLIFPNLQDQHQQAQNQPKIGDEFQEKQTTQSQFSELCQNNDELSSNSKKIQEYQIDQL